MAAERLQKILARAGYGSRRSCEELIQAGRVAVNGQVAELGAKADAASDQITLDGRPITSPEKLVYIALYKPRNVISAVQSPDRRKTVSDLVPVPERVFPVGRLDVDSEGLVLMTNDGRLANRLTHPRYEHEKEYHVLVARQPDEEQLNTWRRGVVLDDGYRTAPAQVRLMRNAGKGAWLRVVLKEGRKRQIRETAGRIGLPVVKLIRVRMGTLQLGGLKPGDWRYLSDDELLTLQQAAGLKPAQPARKPTSKKGKSKPANKRKPRG